MSTVANLQRSSAAMAARVDGWGVRLLALGRWPAVCVVLAHAIVLPLALDLSVWLLISTAAFVTATGWICSRGLQAGLRSRFRDIMLLTAAFQLLVWLILTWVQADQRFVVLGPDGVRYHRLAVQLASHGLSTGADHPIQYLGTADLGHYFVFATVIALFGDDLLALQFLNIGFLVLATGLIYLWTAAVAPRWAHACALLTATHLPIVLLAAVDLWKDPLVILGTSVVVWAMVGTFMPQHDPYPWRARVAMVVGLVSLHVTRFYVPVYLEVGMLLVAGGLLFTHFSRARLVSVVGVLLVVVVAELIPIAAGWPSGPRLFVASVFHTAATPQMRDYSEGMVVTVGKSKLMVLDEIEESEAAAESLRVRIPGFPGRVIVAGLNTGRRLFGPFVWVPPETLDGEVLLKNLYLHYPGMLVWYALLPLITAGLLLQAWRLRAVDASAAPLVALALCLCLYFAQYLWMNLATRQRDVMFPFLLPFAAIAYERLGRSRAGRRVYVAYWVGLCSLALAHLVMRASLGL